MMSRSGSLRLRACSHALCATVLFAVWGSCIQFSPFETALPEQDRDQTRKNLAKLAQRPAPSHPWRFAVVSDSHTSYDALWRIVQALNTRDDLELVLHLGDMTDFGLRWEYQNTLHILQKLRVPVFTVIGNHDAVSNGIDIYESMFGPFDYTFAHGDILFVLFNTNGHEFYQELPDLAWLDARFHGLDGEAGVIAAGHAPPSAATMAVASRHQVLALFSGHLEGSWLERVGATQSYNVEGANKNGYAIVEVDGTGVSIEGCADAGCVEAAP